MGKSIPLQIKKGHPEKLPDDLLFFDGGFVYFNKTIFLV